MDKEYMRKIGKYKYRALDFPGWNEYVKETYKNIRIKNIKTKAKKDIEQVKNACIHFCHGS